MAIAIPFSLPSKVLDASLKLLVEEKAPLIPDPESETLAETPTDFCKLNCKLLSSVMVSVEVEDEHLRSELIWISDG